MDYDRNSLGLLVFGILGRRADCVSGSRNPSGYASAAPFYDHVKVGVRIIYQWRQGYRFYQFMLLVVIILRFIIDHVCTT